MSVDAAERLRARKREILPRRSRRQGVLRLLRPAPLMWTAAAILLAVVGLEFRQTGPPALRPPTGPDVYRSNTLVITGPSGDLRQPPAEFRWEAAAGAVRYQVRLMEVDRNEFWRGDTTVPRLAVPATVQARIVPAKTLLWQVTAFDAAGSKVGESETVRFRLLQ